MKRFLIGVIDSNTFQDDDYKLGSVAHPDAKIRRKAVDLAVLLDSAAQIPALRSVIDAADSSFLAPGQMTERIAEACRASGQPVPATPAEFTRCILDSLALAHRQAIDQASVLADHPVDVVHVVGGGVRNALLCQLTADACGLPVVAGPAEAAHAV